jgi:hypothetical protein
MGILVYKVCVDLLLKPYIVDDISIFNRDVQVIDFEDFLIHIWKEKKSYNPSLERNALITFLCLEPFRGDAWVYALHKSTNTVVDIAELGEFLRRMYADRIGVCGLV